MNIGISFGTLIYSFWITNENFLLFLLPFIYFLWGRIFRSLSHLKMQLFGVFSFKILSHILDTEKVWVLWLVLSHLCFGNLGAPRNSIVNLTTIFCIYVKSLMKLDWNCIECVLIETELTSQSFVFSSMNTGCHSLYLDILNFFHPSFLVFNVQVFPILA